MSTLAETYSLQVGVKLGKPQVLETFYPCPHPIEKTILLHGFGGAIVNGNQATFPAKIYDYFAEVVSILKPIVEPLGYKIIQIGAPGEPNIKGVESLVGRTSILQCTYLVRRAALLIGNDSLWAHQRGAFGGALVALYGSTSIKNHGPYWNNKDKTILIESHRFGKTPSYQSMEMPKTINFITPESVANAALKLLGQEPIQRTSLNIGQAYNHNIIEIVPNVVVDPRLQFPDFPVIRMDYLKNEDFLKQNLQFRKCAVIINSEIDLKILSNYKPNIASIRLEIDKLDPEWIKRAKKCGVPLAYMAVEKDKAKIEEMRLKYYDACFFDQFVPTTIEDFKKNVEKYTQKPFDTNIKLDTLSFKTNKFILSDNKVFLSHAHWLAGKSTDSTDNNTGKVIDSAEFWEDLEHFYIYL